MWAGIAIVIAWASSVFAPACLAQPCNVADVSEVGGTAELPGIPDTQLTVDDVIVFIQVFDDAVGCPGASPCNLADITGIGGLPEGPDGQITVDDIVAFMNVFGDGCPPIRLGENAASVIWQAELSEEFERSTNSIELSSDGQRLKLMDRQAGVLKELASRVHLDAGQPLRPMIQWEPEVNGQERCLAISAVGGHGIYHLSSRAMQATQGPYTSPRVIAGLALFGTAGDSADDAVRQTTDDDFLPPYVTPLVCYPPEPMGMIFGPVLVGQEPDIIIRKFISRNVEVRSIDGWHSFTATDCRYIQIPEACPDVRVEEGRTREVTTSWTVTAGVETEFRTGILLDLMTRFNCQMHFTGELTDTVVVLSSSSFTFPLRQCWSVDWRRISTSREVQEVTDVANVAYWEGRFPGNEAIVGVRTHCNVRSVKALIRPVTGSLTQWSQVPPCYGGPAYGSPDEYDLFRRSPCCPMSPCITVPPGQNPCCGCESQK